MRMTMEGCKYAEDKNWDSDDRLVLKTWCKKFNAWCEREDKCKQEN
jgi:hypothetical protein